MGNNSSQDLKETTFRTTNPRLSGAKIIQNSSKRKYIEAEFTAQATECQNWRNQLRRSDLNSTSNYLLLPDRVDVTTQSELCGNTGTVTNQYPYYPFILTDLIFNHREENKLFKESELWYALFALAAALREIRIKSQKLGDIKPDNVFINAEGKIRVANIFSWPDEKPSYFKVIEYQKEPFNGLLAPEDFALLKENRPNEDNDQNAKSEIFAIGATVLAAALLDQDFSSVYNYSKRDINLQALQKKKMQFRSIDCYSLIFKAILLSLLVDRPENRISLQQLWDFISPFEEAIVKKEKFTILSAPEKVEIAVQAIRSNRIY